MLWRREEISNAKLLFVHYQKGFVEANRDPTEYSALATANAVPLPIFEEAEPRPGTSNSYGVINSLRKALFAETVNSAAVSALPCQTEPEPARMEVAGRL